MGTADVWLSSEGAEEEAVDERVLSRLSVEGCEKEKGTLEPGE